MDIVSGKGLELRAGGVRAWYAADRQQQMPASLHADRQPRRWMRSPPAGTQADILSSELSTLAERLGSESIAPLIMQLIDQLGIS